TFEVIAPALDAAGRRERARVIITDSDGGYVRQTGNIDRSQRIEVPRGGRMTKLANVVAAPAFDRAVAEKGTGVRLADRDRGCAARQSNDVDRRRAIDCRVVSQASFQVGAPTLDPAGA